MLRNARRNPRRVKGNEKSPHVSFVPSSLTALIRSLRYRPLARSRSIHGQDDDYDHLDLSLSLFQPHVHTQTYTRMHRHTHRQMDLGRTKGHDFLERGRRRESSHARHIGLPKKGEPVKRETEREQQQRSSATTQLPSPSLAVGVYTSLAIFLALVLAPSARTRERERKENTVDYALALFHAHTCVYIRARFVI